ncbi:unnamed protein product [Bursaphelenchus xylophilus]|uniref:(pine wood nematode) hypothetical protein n=1 Tax=Bursaphelenchus xylophilus TaxID=6326 RepID=A0A1I7SEV8_BURXY|nr:unnamed protein product [Bursaphelenchus xylophilus]CAG9113232.1 unnamed protein product [Bursaphelenchus xylophilus]
MANVTESVNNRLRNYERDLEKHLRSVVLQLEEQLRNSERTLKQSKAENSALTADEEPIRKEIKKLQKDVGTNQEAGKRVYEKAENDEMAKRKADERLKELREDLQDEILKEKDLRFNLDEVNHQINLVQNQLDSIAWPEKSDVKMMKTILNKASTDVKGMEKEKRIQDAYIERLRRDIEIAENELEQLAVTVRHLKFERDNEKDEFSRLQSKLETFQSGTLRLEDHFGKLMKSLQDNRNKVQLLDKRKRDLSRNTFANKQNDVAYLASKRGAELQRRIARLAEIREKQEQRIIKRTATNNHLRTVVNQLKQKHLVLVERDLEEARKQNKTLKRQCSQTEAEHNQVRSTKQTSLTPNDVQTVSAHFEEIEKLLFYNEFKLKAYTDVLNELNELLKRRKESDNLAGSSLHLSRESGLTVNEGMRRSKSENLDDGVWGKHKKYKGIRDSITELVRKKIALEYRRKRMEEKIVDLRVQHSRVMKDAAILQNEQTTIEKSHDERRTSRLQAQSQSQELPQENGPEDLVNKRIQFAESRLLELNEENKKLDAELRTVLQSCLEYQKKLDGFEAEQNLAEKHAEHLQEIHKLQKRHQSLEKQLWKAQKDMEFAVMRRDYAVNRARTVLGTHNEIRVQRQSKIEKLRTELEEMEHQLRIANSL